MYIACFALIAVSGVVILAGLRVRRLVPKHWATVPGDWIGPALQFSPHPYRYRTPDGVERTGSSRVKVVWRAPFGGNCLVAYDPQNPATSQPAQLRTNGTLLIAVGAFAAIAGVALLAVSLR
ncbi:DUF3592 domain-containing protein [Leucobacter aridicollis]|uniref:DUF3592 domain-containing protein n=1 Tax=Leucobacter aridicollis TaxID=283878 RepID=UPI002102423A|nr:DUF3592 domain-containing protein [Leucobacter aridicollis]UTX53770.1 hypothetical protein KI794_03270 [Leucobacter aridicollis]